MTVSVFDLTLLLPRAKAWEVPLSLKPGSRVAYRVATRGRERTADGAPAPPAREILRAVLIWGNRGPERGRAILRSHCSPGPWVPKRRLALGSVLGMGVGIL